MNGEIIFYFIALVAACAWIWYNAHKDSTAYMSDEWMARLG